MRVRRLVLTVLLLPVLLLPALVVGTPGAAFASGTPRSQFWSGFNRTGDKLDKDVTSTGDAHIPDLSKEGRGCGWFGCAGNWDNMIRSLDTTGGGQSPTFLIVYPFTLYQGTCIFVPAGRTLNDLRAVAVSGFGRETVLNMDLLISSFEVFTWDPNVRDRCWTVH